MAEDKINWAEMDKQFGDLEDDISESDNNSYESAPDGEYDVTVTHMELGKSKVKENGKGGDPMLKVTFQIMAGENEGTNIFSNSVLQMWQEKAKTRQFQIHNVNTLLRAIADDPSIKWTSFAELARIVDDIFADVGTLKNADGSLDEGWHYKLVQTTNENNSDFKDLEIVEVLD